ncbi:MAG: PorP/SprF family type IX secretion system membrane protein [Paludibacteraceae bacterium]|nr:PorP/SprF family type IX secretion system membrane protein [Paludibacteraceae bacterium]
MKKYLVILVMSLLGVSAYAQRDLMLSQQFFSRLNMNPSATGNTDDVDLFLIGRWQWIGVSNGPKTGVLNFSNYFESARSGIGMSVTYDDLGYANRTMNIKAAYAYHVNLNESMLMSFGLSAGILYHYFDPQKNIWLDPQELENESLNFGEKLSKVNPDMDFGVELAMPKLLVGASVNHLLYNEDKVTTSRPGRQFNVYVRALLSPSEKIDLAPALVYVHRNQMQRMELNFLLFYNRFLWFGVTYRPDLTGVDLFSSNVLQFSVGFEYKKFRLGYSFDLGLGDVARSVSSNASELLLSWRIPKTTKGGGARFLEDY